MTEIVNTEIIENEIDVAALYGPVGNGIQTVAKTSTSGLNDTYTITYTDGTTSTFVLKNGRGISSFQKTSSTDLTDTYTITYNDGTTSTFTVTNDVEDVSIVAENSENISTVAANLDGNNSIGTVATNILNIDTVGINISAVTTVSQNIDNITAVVSDIATITAVNNNETNINAVNANKANIDTVAGSIANVNKVGNSIGSVNDVAEVFDTVDGGSSSSNSENGYDGGSSSSSPADTLSGGDNTVQFKISPDDIRNISEIGSIKASIPTKTSDLTNDSGFLTSSGLPTATTSQKGVVKPDGTTIAITYDGVISAIGGASGGANTNLSNLSATGEAHFVKPTSYATTSTAGVVKPDGTTITVTADGTISGQSLANYVTNTDYASSSTGGVVKVNTNYGLTTSSGVLVGSTKTYAQYGSASDTTIISKGTLDNVITEKSLETVVTTISDSSTTAIEKNNIYTISEATALTVTYPATPDNTFIAEVDFTSGSTATTLTIPSGTKFKGDDTTTSAFTPVTSKRYQCIFTYDGVSFRCVVSGEAIA